MSTVIIITPPPTKPQANTADVPPVDYLTAYEAIEQAESAGMIVRVITD